LVDYVTTLTNWNGVNRLTLTDASGFNPDGGTGWYNVSGTWASFAYGATVNNVLVGVSLAPPGSVTDVANRNGSFCHTDATLDGTISTTRLYCDDDYTDSDADGLADWEELLGVFGWFSNPTLADTDGDGVNDFGEVVRDNTDPLDACKNALDPDGDGLNSYFENSTGCTLDSIGILNGSSDVWVTDPTKFDTDSGGVNDLDEYFDGTNPENDPSDDILPDDFDGDGIPDAFENLTGTDWRNPDTDGGGVIDGVECPANFWATGCVGSPQDPLDPSDDFPQSQVIFWANNTSGTVDLEQVHRWRQVTNDFPTGSTYVHLATVHPSNELFPNIENLSGMADLGFSNSTVIWNVQYNTEFTGTPVPVPLSTINHSFWADATAELSRTNDTFIVNVDAGFLQSLIAVAPEYWFDWDTLASSTIANQTDTYALQLDDRLSNRTNPWSIALNITEAVVAEAGVSDAWSTADAIATFLREGNATTEFKRNYNGSGLPGDQDIAVHLLEVANEGTCQEFTTAFVTMARLAGLPARSVSGFAGGTWTGNGYAVTNDDRTTWAEVHLQQDAANGNTDMGWVPFEACPDAELLEIVNQSLTPLSWERNGQTWFNVSGQLRYADNSTPVPDQPVVAFFVPIGEVGNVPGIAATPERQIGSAFTDANGSFNISGIPPQPIAPGFAGIVIQHVEQGYVSNGGIPYATAINVSDNTTLTHQGPTPINAPIVGAGATTEISGLLQAETIPQNVFQDLEGLEVWLSFTSSVDGDVNLSTPVNPDGSWVFDLTLDEFESKTNISALIGFSGWTDTSVPIAGDVHLRPSTTGMVLDVRDAPNLTATLEGPGTNVSVLDLGDDIWVNGTVVSFGLAPASMNGSLVLSLRDIASGGAWVDVFNVTVNGTFSVQHTLNASTTPIAAGEVEPRLRFFPEVLPTTDIENLSDDAPYRLRGIYNYTMISESQLRGEATNTQFQVVDHLGNGVGIVMLGTYDVFFNGSLATSIVDPLSNQISPTWNLDATLRAGDYPLAIEFGGSDDYVPSVWNSSLRVMAEISWNFTVADDWVHIGNSTQFFGNLSDAVYGDRVLNNGSALSILMATAEGPVDLAIGALNTTTGGFSFNVTAPTIFAGGVYEVQLLTDFLAFAPEGGPYYQFVDPNGPQGPPSGITLNWGIESEVIVTPELESIQVLIGDTIDLRARITDIADGSDLEGATVEWFLDWNGVNTSLGTAQTLVDGNASIQWTANSLGPGYYDIGVVVADDVTDPIAPGNRRHFGNISLVNATVQTESVVVIDVAPTVVAADSTFNVLGRVLDADDNTRPINGLLRLDAYWGDEPEELLITGAQTAANGSFNLSLSSDAFNDGTTRGNRTLLVQVIEDSSPFYLPSNTTTDMLVQGVTDFEQLLPRNAVIINRGRSVDLSAQLVEASDLFTPLGGETVAVKVHETWHTEVQTDGEGFANTSFLFDLNHPLGIITVEFHYNGSFDLLDDRANLSTVTVRSTTVLLIDPITANPTSASSFNVTGTVLSDNGSGLENRDGSVLPANVLFAIDGQPVGFTVTGGSVGVGGAWTASITLGQTFERGSHNISATYVPSVNFYVGSNDTAPFDSRGTTSVFFLDPVLDGLGSPSLNDRAERGSDMDLRVMVQDNTGAPVANADVQVTLIGSDGPLTVPVTLTLVTDASGMAQDVMTLPANLSVGEATLTADYGGLPGTTGLVGSNTSTRFVVLASTEIAITEAPVSLVAGDAFDVRGTLLDDLGLPLAVDGTPSLAIVHLLVDGVPVSSVETDASNGSFLLSYVLPQGTDPGLHQVSVQFKGGRDWVDPIGVGDPANPEYYLPTQTDVDFNVSMPSKIILTSGSGDVDRETTITISGVLLSQVDDAIGGATIEVWLDGAFLTNVTTDANGSFTALHPVPADQRLGATDMEVRFTGTVLYLPSNASGYWNVYAPILVTVDLDDVIAVADQVEITGQVVDNQLQGLADHTVFLEVDGVNIGEVTTSSDGRFTYTWLVPDIFVFGDHVLIATADSQGWYRAGSGNASFYLSHRSAISISFDGDDEVTRGDLWRISGRLYDVDDAAQAGLPGRDVQVYLDGELVTVATTLEDGSWLATVPVELDLARGEHDLEVRFEGELAHRPTDASTVGTVWSDVVVTIDAVSDRTAVRSDALRTLILTGSVTEVGGEGEVFEDLDLTLSNGTGCTSASATPTCYTLERVQWNDGNFSMTLRVPSWNPLGVQPFHVGSNTNSSRNLNSGTAVTFALIKVDATIQVRIDNIVEDDKEDFGGSILVTADDTGEGIPDVGFSLYLEYANGSRVVQDGSTQQLLKRVVVTGSDGSTDYDFNHDPPYGDASEFGELTLLVLLDAGGERLTDASLATFQAEAAEGFGPDYAYSDEASSVTRTLVGALVLLVVGLLSGLVLYRRRQQATLMEEAAEVFAYTAELLAAGDSVREAIFQCYTDLCVVLQKREFLRRDFETVREFEAAIRQAMPAVSEEALVALDNVFEQARYGRDEMSEGHAQAAKVAMERMSTEVTSIQKIIPRGL
jgi:transglutaminase-like putative cysteine protease